MTTKQTIDGVPRELSVSFTLTKQQERDILRFYDTCEDGQGYDVPKDRMKSLARLGLIRPTGFSRYEITDAGDAVIEKLRALLDADQRPEGCCCPPKGYTGVWAGAMCPIHFGLRAIKPAAQVQGEPVAWKNFDGEGGYDFTEDKETADRWAISNGSFANWLVPLYAEQPAPVAVK